MYRLFKKRSAKVVAELDASYLGQLPVICLVVCLYYSFISVAHFFFLEDSLFLPVFGTSTLVVFASFILMLMVQKNLVKPEICQVSFVPVVLLIFITVYVHIYLSGDSLQLTNAVMFIYALGFVTLSPPIYTFLLILSSALYIVCLVVLKGPYAIHMAFMFVAVTMLSIMGFIVRYRALMKISMTLVSSRRKARHLAIAGAKLQTKIEEVQAANEAKDIFLANVTHELKTPLTGVIGMLDLLKSHKLGKDQKFMVNTARKSADYLLHVINDLLDLSKLGAGKLELRERPVDLVEVTMSALETFRAQAEAKGLEVVFDSGDLKTLPALVDDARLSQILLNLINNAVKFTDEGLVTVHIEQQGSAVLWHVQDTGPGIAPHEMDHIFTRFEQLDKTSTRDRSGAGLGLSIVCELVQLMGGKIELHSEVGQGSDFAVSLPVKFQSVDDIVSQPIAESISKVPSVNFSDLNLRALVAEDNLVNQMLIQRILERMGLNVTIVENGELAVAAAKDPENNFDLIFMDMQMPVMDGITAAKHILASGADVPPIIALTANTHESDRQSYLAAGMVAMIGKPINIQACQQTIMDVLQKD